MTLSRSTPLGPQCLLCKKRRVKCDSGKPTCQRCARDGRKCPRYTKALVWRTYGIDDVPIKANESSSSSLKPAESIANASSFDAEGHLPSFRVSDLLVLSRPLFTPSETKSWHIADSCMYFNRVIIPDLAPLPKLYRDRYTTSVETWMEVPLLLQNILLVITINHRVVRRGGRPLSSTELLEHRGEALTELRLELQMPSTTTSFIALIAVITMVQFEIQVSATTGWHAHLEAARSIIAELGGLTACWNMFPHVRALFAAHIQIDILSLTTTPTSMLVQMKPDAFNMQLQDLESLDMDVLSTCCPFSPTILSVIATSNFTRYALASGTIFAQDAVSAVTEATRQLQSFDSAEWGHYIVEIELPTLGAWDVRMSKELAIEEWKLLGGCYQAAAILYSIRSLQSLIDCSGTALNEDVAASLLSLDHLVETQRRVLHTNLQLLFSHYDCGKQSNASMKMYKFVLWPLFIGSYEVYGWDFDEVHLVPSHLQQDSPKTYLNRLRRLGTELGAKSYLDAAKQLEIVAARRTQQPTTQWRWDDAFNGRCAFIF